MSEGETKEGEEEARQALTSERGRVSGFFLRRSEISSRKVWQAPGSDVSTSPAGTTGGAPSVYMAPHPARGSSTTTMEFLEKSTGEASKPALEKGKKDSMVGTFFTLPNPGT